ncbi:MAG TPA: alpha/beta fold hydrolase [Candidatus Acidoferrum sp.]
MSANEQARRETFSPHPLLRSGHLQTLAAAYIPRRFTLPPATERFFQVAPDTQLKGMCHWHPDKPKERPIVVTVHGLEGSSESNYAVGIAEKAFARGFHAIRLNQRNCGGTERLTPTLYNSGMSGDYRAVLVELVERDGFDRVFFAGYSMGGNLVTKMAGEFAANPPEQLRAVAAVCPALDLSACADALEKPENYFYQRHFVKGLLSRYRRKAELFPERYSQNGFGPIRTVREFDDAITAPCFGYRDAEEYYQAAGAKKVIAAVGLPLLMITAQDDPFVPFESFLRAAVGKNAAVRFLTPQHGGHCGFISRWAGHNRFWAEERVVDFFAGLANRDNSGVAVQPSGFSSET